MRLFKTFSMVFAIGTLLVGCTSPTPKQASNVQVTRVPTSTIDPRVGLEATLQKLDETFSEGAGQYTHDYSDKEANLIAFKAMMTPVANATDAKERNKIVMQGFRSYFDRTFISYYIGFSMVRSFDEKLNELLSLKKANKPYDANQIQEFILKLNITRALYERNQHRFADLYENLLDAANDPNNEFHNEAKMGLSSFRGIFDSYKKEGHGLAVMNLANLLEEVNEEYRRAHPDAVALTYFKKYFVSNTEALKKLEAQAKANLSSPKFRLMNSFLAKKWKEELQNSYDKSAQEREPQSDNLYPSPGGTGNITGNRFRPGLWALTFDDGPHPIHTVGMINALASVNLKGTFFWLSQNVEKYPAMSTLAEKNGFNRGSHSFSHANLPKLSDVGLKHEISDAHAVFQKVVGKPPTLFRCPYGACGGNNSKIREMIADRKMLHVFWNVDSLDWQDKNPQGIYDRVVKQMQLLGRGIILFHDIHPQSVKAVEMLMSYIKKNPNLEFTTMDRIVEIETGKPYPSP